MDKTFDAAETPVSAEGDASGQADGQPRGGGPAAARRFNRGIRRAGSSALVRTENDQWRHLHRLIATEYPYCVMIGVNIAGGNIVSCDNIQKRFAFGPAEAVSPEIEFDERWQALKSLCGKIKTGRLIELTFLHGRPTGGIKSEGGRRFKNLLQGPQEG